MGITSSLPLELRTRPRSGLMVLEVCTVLLCDKFALARFATDANMPIIPPEATVYKHLLCSFFGETRTITYFLRRVN